MSHCSKLVAFIVLGVGCSKPSTQQGDAAITWKHYAGPNDITFEIPTDTSAVSTTMHESGTQTLSFFVEGNHLLAQMSVYCGNEDPSIAGGMPPNTSVDDVVLADGTKLERWTSRTADAESVVVRGKPPLPRVLLATARATGAEAAMGKRIVESAQYLNLKRCSEVEF